MTSVESEGRAPIQSGNLVGLLDEYSIRMVCDHEPKPVSMQHGTACRVLVQC